MSTNYPGQGIPDEKFNWSKWGPAITCALAFLAVIIAVVAAGSVMHSDTNVTTQSQAVSQINTNVAAINEKINAIGKQLADLETRYAEISDAAIKDLSYKSIRECLNDIKSRLLDVEISIQKIKNALGMDDNFQILNNNNGQNLNNNSGNNNGQNQNNTDPNQNNSGNNTDQN